MLLVADDANAAYSNPRSLPKCAQTPLPYSEKSTALHRSGRTVRRQRRTSRQPGDVVTNLPSKKSFGRVAAGTDTTLGGMGYRGEDVSAMRGARGRHTPWQSSD